MSALFPMFVELDGRRCLVVGASTMAEAKIRSLIPPGASVRVVAPDGTALVEKWARTRKISWEKRLFHPDDLKSELFVVAATSLQKTNESVLQEAQKRGILCSVAEVSNRCDFYLLLEWLPQVQDPYIKETLVRAVYVPSAKPFAAPVLIEEFRKTEPSQTFLKLAIGNALSVVADDSVCNDIIELAQGRKHGKARQLTVLALGNMKDPHTTKAAMPLLNDEVVAGHAVMALGRLKAKGSRNSLKPFLHHSRAWVRREAQKVIQQIDGSITSQFGHTILPQMAKPAIKYKKRA